MTLKVISLNLWLGGKLMPQILEFLKTEDADVLLLQEVYNSPEVGLPNQFHSYPYIKRALSYKYGIYSQALIHDIAEGLVPNGNAILSKYPITDNKDIFLTKPELESYKDIPELFPAFPRLLQQATIKINSRLVDLYNIHGVWDLDGDNNSRERQNMKQTILNEVSNKDLVVLGGDTNAKASNPALQALEPTLKSVFGESLQTTFNLSRKTNPGYADADVDLMYVSPQIEVVSKAVPNIDISDHLPLVVTLDLPD